MTTDAPAQSQSQPESQPRKTNLSHLVVAIIIVVFFLGVAGVYVITGSDPLGLYTVNPAESPLTANDTVTDINQWWEVYFTDPIGHSDPENLSGTITEKLIAAIDQAQTSIHIAAFEFDVTPIAEALVAADKRGVEILWVTDDEYGLGVDGESGNGQFAMIKKAGVKVKDDGREALMHNKFIIIDGKTVWTGSTNLTINGIYKNNNNMIVIHSPELAAIYELEFQEMWDGHFGPLSPATTASQSLTINGTPVYILFSSEDEVLRKLLPIVNTARKSIRIMAFSFTHDFMGAIVIDKANSGVDVQAIFETRGSETVSSELDDFFCGGVPVRQDGNPSSFHHKVIIIDGETVITGSLNFSENADNVNDENTIIITNPEIAALYLQEFNLRWAEANDPQNIICE